jgi:acylphosphatase
MNAAGSEPRVIARRLMIHGRVQGVYYRATAQQQAQRLELDGWVRNRHDGTVEALVCGSEEGVDAFIGWARKGPPAARVDSIDITPADPPDAGPFAQRPTA